MTVTSHPNQLGHGPLVPPHLRRPNVVPNQLLFRELNEQLALRHDACGHGERELEVVCECESQGCSTPISLPRGRYEAVRRHPTRFVIAPGHAGSDQERTVERHDGFVVVERTGSAARIAIRLDPRRRHAGAHPAA